jgi:hypothetical protein
MKIKSSFIPAAVVLFFTSFCTSAYAQDTQIEGKSYETISKVNLTSEAEFVKLKQKSAVTTSDESFIKVNNEYAKTSFTAAALKNFFTTGKLSSLGTVKKTKMAGNPVTYIDNGSSIAIVNYNKEAIGFIEIVNQKQVLALRNRIAKASNDDDPGGSTGDPLLDCGVVCLNTYIACGNSALCRSAYKKCWSDCKNRHQSQGGSGSSPSYYILSINALAIKF